MAQGTIKQKKIGPAKKQNPLRLTKGDRKIAPKNKKLIEQQKVAKKLSAGLAAKTERTLAQRAGHLELLAGGKKSKNEGKKGSNKGGVNKKGGK